MRVWETTVVGVVGGLADCLAFFGRDHGGTGCPNKGSKRVSSPSIFEYSYCFQVQGVTPRNYQMPRAPLEL